MNAALFEAALRHISTRQLDRFVRYLQEARLQVLEHIAEAQGPDADAPRNELKLLTEAAALVRRESESRPAPEPRKKAEKMIEIKKARGKEAIDE